MSTRYTSAHWGTYKHDGSGGLLPVDDDPAPSRAGKGWVSAARDMSSRVLAPVVRRGWIEGDQGAGRCADSFVEVSWDDATGFVAEEIQRVSNQHGNGAIFGGSYGWSSAGRFHHAQGQMRRFLNLTGGFVSSRETYSHAAAEVLFPHVLGLTHRQYQDQITSLSLVEEHCELLVCFGGFSHRTAQIASSGTSTHEVGDWLQRLSRRGVRIINVSPQNSDISAVPSEWLSIRPGTDAALMLALACEITSAGREAQDFLAQCTSGWPEFRAYLTGESDGVAKSAEWAAPICGLEADSIRDLAEALVAHRSMISVAWALQRADHGEQPLWAGLGLACVVGQIGQSGTGFGFGYGSVTVNGRPARLIPWPSVSQGQNAVSDYIPVARIADMLLNPGQTYAYNGQVRTYPDIRLVYWTGGNPFHHHQDLLRLERAWTRPETVIVNEHSWTATARRADIVLPATTPLERNDIMMNRRDPKLFYMSQLFSPRGQSRDDYDIFRMIAGRMGLEEAFSEGRSSDAWLRDLWSRSQGVARDHGFELPAYDEFAATGRFEIPEAAENRISLEAFVSDPVKNPLNTETGKITLFNHAIHEMALPDCPGHPCWLEPAESLISAVESEFHLISGQPDTRLHAQKDRGSESQADKIRGREPVYIHPEIAAFNGLQEGDIVRIYNDRGICLAGVRFSADIRPDCIALATGAWFDPQEIDGRIVEVHGNPNVLTIDKGTSALAQGSAAHTTLVRIGKWEGELPELTIDRPPPISQSKDLFDRRNTTRQT